MSDSPLLGILWGFLRPPLRLKSSFVALIFEFYPITVLKKDTISSLGPSSFCIMDKNSPNSIFPLLSSSTESIKALISSLVSSSPTDSRSSSNSSMPIEPHFFLSNELKYCFISLLSSLSKSIRYFFPFFVNHFRSSNCFKKILLFLTSSKCWRCDCLWAFESSNDRIFLWLEIRSRTLGFSMSSSRS